MLYITFLKKTKIKMCFSKKILFSANLTFCKKLVKSDKKW